MLEVKATVVLGIVNGLYHVSPLSFDTKRPLLVAAYTV